MSVQTSYTNATPRGVAGGLFDLSTYAMDSRQYKDSGVLRFGTGVVFGTTPGTDVMKPIASSVVEGFEGIAMNGGTTEQTMDGEVRVLSGQTVGVLRYGRAWVRVAPDAEPAYGEDAFLITDGDHRGCFTTADDTAKKIALNMRFIGGRNAGSIAPAELYHQKHDAPSGV